MKKLLLGLSILLLLLITSCTHKQEITDNNIQFDTIGISKNYHLENDSTLPSCNLKIRFVYPSGYAKQDMLSGIQQIFLTSFLDNSYAAMTPREAIEKYAEDYVNNYKEDAKDFFNEEKLDFHNEDDENKYFSYYEKLSNEIKFNKAGLLSFQIIQTNYKGGNNSFQQYTNYVIDLNRNDLLNEDDIFVPDYEKALHAVLLDKLRAANNNMTVSDLEDIGYFGLDEIMPNNNFFVDDKGLTYIFNKGEYSILQLDEINIFVAYEEIKGLLKADSPISVFYK